MACPPGERDYLMCPDPGGDIKIVFLRFGLEWPPAASGPLKSTLNHIFGAILNKFHQIPL